MVVFGSRSGLQETAECAAEVLRAGGNAVDAAIAGVAAVFAAEPLLARRTACLIEKPLAHSVGEARRLASMDYLDIQISLDGTDAVTNDAVRGEGSGSGQG